jgi:hypothetical protein
LPAGTGPLLVDEPVDIAPIGPATAHELGVIMIDRQNALLVLPRRPYASSASRGKTLLSTSERRREDFVAYARGPAVVADFGYWVNQGRLVRRRYDGKGELEVLTSDARNGTRVAARELPTLGAVVAYITKPDEQGAQHAKLWTEDRKVLELTAEGAGTSSVAFARQATGLTALSLDGRSAMTPLHARRVTAENGRVTLGRDVVSTVLGSAQATTEIFAAAAGDDVWAFVPIEQDVTHFGLAQILIGREPGLDANVGFTTYANGLNTAPVATAFICGRLAVAFAEPKDATPNAAQTLQLATIEGETLSSGEIVAEHGSFADASLAAVSGGGLLTFTANHRTWAASIRCRAPSSR